MKNTLFKDFVQGRGHAREVQLHRVRQVIREELTDLQRDAIISYYFQMQTVSQIAAQRGVCKSTVSRTLHRAEEKLRRYLKYSI